MEDLCARHLLEAPTALSSMRPGLGAGMHYPPARFAPERAADQPIDWASRPYGANSFSGKPSAANWRVARRYRRCCRAAEPSQCARVLQFTTDERPEAYIEFTPGRITDDGEVTNDGTAELLRNFVAESNIFIGTVRSSAL